MIVVRTAQRAVRALHQPDVDDDQHEVHENRALCADVERQAEPGETDPGERGLKNGTMNDTEKPITISTAISATLKRQ